jgi:hypothetical protein
MITPELTGKMKGLGKSESFLRHASPSLDDPLTNRAVCRSGVITGR